ncbi:hypothetical protein D2E26_0790 [Bifidobacterium dolichotidis]|uniref:DUF4381 domain-containing protein n=1 Tax=Bifidobacterium dolichotidis TaxID=2306976 RepID=A0A430FPI6_9BIFI|nr:hypothetical protein [Bifidobacterium dolichotidis]RSX54736.1 hypothetical protein D2E26_0790 [Bifidobacterium dolichotidis]
MISVQDLHPQGALSSTGFAITCGVCAIIAVVLVVLVIKFWRPRVVRVVEQQTGSHSAGAKQIWQRRISEVVERFHAGTITEDQAFARLAQIARSFAAQSSGRSLASKTLADLSNDRRSGDSNWNLLRQTIAGMYPPEFAEQPQGVTVDDAAAWVARLVERWR